MMEKDERLLPVPAAKEVQLSAQEYPTAYSPMYEEDGFAEQRSLREYFNVVYKRLPLILALGIIITSVVAFYMYRQPSVFEAQTTMIIETPKPKITSKDAININFGGDVNYMNTQLKLLQNPELMRDVVIRLGLHRDPSLFANQNKGVVQTVKSIFSGDKAKTERDSSLPLLADNPENKVNSDENKVVLTADENERAYEYAGIFLGGLRVLPEERTNLVNIVVQSTNPELAAKVADMTAELFKEKNVESEIGGAKKQFEELKQSIEDLKNTIASQEIEFINEMQRSNIPLRDGKGNDLNAERLTTINTNLLTAEDDRRKIQAQAEAARRASDGKGGILSVVPESKAILAAREQNLKRQADLEKRIEDIDGKIKAAEEERQKLLVTYTEEYPKVKQVVAQVEELTRQKTSLQREVSAKIQSEDSKLIKNAERETVTGLDAQLQAAIRREEQLRADYINEASKANASSVAETKLTTLKREIETNRSLLDTYTQRQKEQELAIASGRPENIKITTQAVKPQAPIGPQRTRNIIVAFLISLAAGVGLAFLLDYLDDSIRTSDDVGRHLGLPTLALIPHQITNEKRKLALAKTNGAGNASTALIALEDTRSAMAEAYRHLRTSLLFSSAGKPPQTILVTSSQPSEGKTTTAINTAITLAQSGAEVVIIDCDLRRPRLHNHFDLDNSAGLTNYLSGEKHTELFMKPCPGLPKLKIVTSGPIPPNPAELLSSQEMKNLLQFLRGNFKHVIIDSPPAISFTDAAILSTLVDGVVLVAMAGKSSIHLMRRFKQRLANIGARIYGVVLNGIKSDSVEYGYYGYGYTYNYYTANDDDSTPRMEDLEQAASVHETKS